MSREPGEARAGRGRPSGARAQHGRAPCVASSAVATARCALDGGEVEEATAPSGCRGQIWTPTSTGATSASARSAGARPRAAGHDRRGEHQQATATRVQPVQRLDEHRRVRVRPERAAAERHVGAGQRRARVAHQAAQHHLDVDRHRRDRAPAAPPTGGGAPRSADAPGASAPRCRAPSGRTAATSPCAPSRSASAAAAAR